MFGMSVELSPETFLILTGIQRDVIIDVHTSYFNVT